MNTDGAVCFYHKNFQQEQPEEMVLIKRNKPRQESFKDFDCNDEHTRMRVENEKVFRMESDLEKIKKQNEEILQENLMFK